MAKLKKTWVLVAQSSHADLYALRGRKLALLESFDNPSAKSQAGDIMADRAGRSFDRKGAGRHALEGVDPVTHRIVSFAKRLGAHLEQARHGGAFEALVLVSAPQFLGHLRNDLPDGVRTLVTREIHKDLGQATEKELTKYVLALP